MKTLVFYVISLIAWLAVGYALGVQMQHHHCPGVMTVLAIGYGLLGYVTGSVREHM